ncbi:MAG TPA: kelch repeat-containing protein [Bryobacterales bacterium]|nr:kelch repeat-containing protein [Bryobacterales bacterium]
MGVARGDHSATLLLNGKVLIAGGYTDAPMAVASAELYDPSTGTFTATGDMTTPRQGHAATLLADGRVLITGGSGLSNTELYDPSTGTFTATAGTGDMIPGGNWARAVLLGNGKVLILGGSNAELYDPATGAFAATGAYAGPSPVFLETATLLPDGRVLITGCAAGCTSGVTELYDPGAGTFSLTGPMMGWDNLNTATLLMNGKVLFVGNSENDGFPAGAEVYDPATGTFASIGNAAEPHEFSAAALVPDGRVLIAGNQLPGGDSDARAELYDSAAGTFSAIGNMTAPRFFQTVTLLRDGTVLIAGGASPTFRASTSSAEIYHPAALVPAPALFSLSGDGRGQGAILHANTPRVASSSDPAGAGDYLEIYLTGLADGSVIPPQVAIGGRMAEILYFGKSGYAGLNQVNVRVPSSVAPGPGVSVRLTYLGRPSNEVTIGVQ